MLHRIYNLLWRIAPIFIQSYLRKRAKKNPEYLEHWDERFAKEYPSGIQNAIWIHAVSVGETRAAQPLIQALQKHYSNTPLLLTQMTPTGRKTAKLLFPEAQCRYLPYDNPEYIKTFLKQHEPKFGILMETEIWPNLIQECHKQQVPLFLANARLSQKSLKGYLKVKSLIKPSMEKLTACFAQTHNDAKRLEMLNTNSLYICGNTKYDVNTPKPMYELAQHFKTLIGNRPVIVCASTREKDGIDEAELILEAWKKYQGDALLIIIPRHPERFQSNFNLAKTMGYHVQKRSEDSNIHPHTQIMIGDSMGELFAYYLNADIAFVGGSLVDTGCQNIIEPLSCGVPTLFGYSTYNFSHACDSALKANAAKQTHNIRTWYDATVFWLKNPDDRAFYSKQAVEFTKKHLGASQTIANHIVSIIDQNKSNK